MWLSSAHWLVSLVGWVGMPSEESFGPSCTVPVAEKQTLEAGLLNDGRSHEALPVESAAAEP